MGKKRRQSKVLFKDEGVIITEDDVDRAIAAGRARLGDEYAELLTARALTPEESAALADEHVADDQGP